MGSCMIYEVGSKVICIKDVPFSMLFVSRDGVGIHSGTVLEVVDLDECDYHLIDENKDSWIIFERHLYVHFNKYDVVERYDDAMGII